MSERQRAMESLLFFTEKGDKTIKSQHCANGSTQHTYMERNEVTSLTVSMEGMLLRTVIEAQEGQDVTTYNIPNAFVKTHVKERWKFNHHEGKGSLCGHPL